TRSEWKGELWWQNANHSVRLTIQNYLRVECGVVAAKSSLPVVITQHRDARRRRLFLFAAEVATANRRHFHQRQKVCRHTHPLEYFRVAVFKQTHGVRFVNRDLVKTLAPLAPILPGEVGNVAFDAAISWRLPDGHDTIGIFKIGWVNDQRVDD